MAAPTIWYFAYASNLSRAQLESRVGAIFDVQIGRLEHHELVFNKKVRGGSAEANVRPARGKTVLGVLYRITESGLRNLDRASGVPMHYRRISVTVLDAAGNKVTAQAYIASKVEKGLRPASYYLQSILQGAGEHGLPEEYIAGIKQAAGVA